jgi:hypothetical protein
MQQTRVVKAFSAIIFKVLLCLCVLLPVYAHSDSGIAIKQTLAISGASSAPPPDQTHESWYAFVIENNNDVCDEEVLISVVNFTPGFLGVAKFLGFTDSPGSPYDGNVLHFELEDETEKTIYFGVETGEDVNGCDFDHFAASVKVCDTGIHGFYGCDAADADKPCEAPTPKTQSITQEATPVAQPEGSGRIYGHVDNSSGDSLLALIGIIKDGFCVPGQPDNTDKFIGQVTTSQYYPNVGYYEATNLPYGTYSVTAQRDGSLQLQTVTLTIANPDAQANFTF